MPAPKDTERKGQSIEISFGSIHTSLAKENLQFVVLDVGTGRSFSVSTVLEEGRLGPQGTELSKNLGDAIGHMGMEEIIKGLELTLGKLSPYQKSRLEEYSKKPARIITV